jgi:uncharacterized integral membrane protein
MLLITGMIIAVTSDPFQLNLFYAMLGGAIIIIIYSTIKNRRAQKELRRQRRKSKK